MERKRKKLVVTEVAKIQQLKSYYPIQEITGKLKVFIGYWI